MDELLAKITPEKRDKIFNSAFAEFGKNGFEKASTNVIVEKAEISKGLLFHYFGSKQKFYEILTSFALEYITQLLEEGINWQQNDFFLRVQQIAALKLAAVQKYPHIYDFLRVVMENLSVEETKQHWPQQLLELSQRVYKENIDYTLFRDDIDLEKALEIIKWTVDGATSKVWQKAASGKTIEQAMAEHQEYMAML